MKFFDRLFFDHPNEIGETYRQHFRCAITVSFKLGCASFCQMLHAIVPGIKPPCGTDLKSVVEFCNSHLPTKRKRDNEQRRE
jgi:hypothetical protein